MLLEYRVNSVALQRRFPLLRGYYHMFVAIGPVQIKGKGERISVLVEGDVLMVDEIVAHSWPTTVTKN